MNALRAGAARRDITPRTSLYLAGYPNTPRASTGVHDPLTTTALALSDGDHTVIFVALDLLMLSHGFANECRAEIAAATGVPVDGILVSTTHTHSAPITVALLAFRGDPLVPPPDPAYMTLVRRSIVDAAVEAYARLAPARIAVTTADARGVGGNRHAPDGAADPEVGILAVQDAGSGTLLALSVTYSMHPTVLHEDSTLVSADFPGLARALVEAQFPGALVLYHTGPAGNQSPRLHVTGQTFAEAERLGHQLGEAVVAAVRALAPDAYSGPASGAVPVGAATCAVALPGRTFPSIAEAEAALEAAVRTYEQLKAAGAPHGPVRTAEVSVFGAEEQVVLARAQVAGEIETLRAAYTPTALQALRVGDVAYVGLPGEWFVEYGLAIKAQACARTFVISLANGELQGYIVTPEATGYEASFSLFLPEAGAIAVDAAVRLVCALMQ